MHSPEIRQKFVERRAQGWPFSRIATDLGVARSTLIEWSRQLRFEIQNRRAIELEDLSHRLLGNCQSRTSTLAARLALVDEELKKRDLSKVPTARLYSLSAALQRQIVREIGELQFIVPAKDIPNDEYVDQVQEWQI
jgi:hypothetical protein